MIKFNNKYTQLNWKNLDHHIAFVSDEGFYKKQWQDNYLLLLATMPLEIRKILEDSSVNIGSILEETA
jgi:hypothetical protein|tara:strand:+ start:1736 stop:1939 length:204 start_codon:yes stop_codon:yes gene_type:complete